MPTQSPIAHCGHGLGFSQRQFLLAIDEYSESQVVDLELQPDPLIVADRRPGLVASVGILRTQARKLPIGIGEILDCRLSRGAGGFFLRPLVGRKYSDSKLASGATIRYARPTKAREFLGAFALRRPSTSTSIVPFLNLAGIRPLPAMRGNTRSPSLRDGGRQRAFALYRSMAVSISRG
jgi:hypothetical protein